MKKLIMIIMFVVGISYGQTSNLSIPYTLEDRERSIRMEQNQLNMQKQIESNQINLQRQIESNQINLQKQIDNQQNITYILITTVLGLFGFVIWDRKTTLSPFKEEIRDNKKAFIEELKTYKEAFAAIAKIEPKFRDAMHKLGML